MSILMPKFGAVGGGTDLIFYQNEQVINTSYSLPDGYNYGSFGPIEISATAVVTILANTTLTVV